MVAISKKSVAWILTLDGVPAEVINLRLKKYSSVLDGMIKNVTG